MPLPNTLNKWMKPSVGKFSSPSALNNSQPTTSISRLNSSSSVRTSVFGKPLADTTSNLSGGQEAMDTARYGYVRGLIKQRQAKEAKEEKIVKLGKVKEIKAEPKEQKSKFGIKLGTGISFSRSPKVRSGFDRTLRRMRLRDSKTTFRNLSKENVKFLGDVIQKHAVSRRTGSGYDWRDRRQMNKEVWQAFRKGKDNISRADLKDFRKIIKELK